MHLRTNGRRRVIVLDDGTPLAVPPFHPNTPSKVRTKIYELVLRRQPGEAEIVAQIAADATTGGNERDRLASLMGASPYTSSAMEVA